MTCASTMPRTSTATAMSTSSASPFGAPGTIALGYSSKMISARVTILSDGNEANVPETVQVDKVDPDAWFTSGIGHTDPVSPRTVNSGSWAYGLWVTANPIAMLSADLKGILFMDTVTTTNNWAGFGGSLTLKPVDLISVVVGADAFSDMADVFELDLKPALTVNLGDDALTASMYYTTFAVAQTDSGLDASVKFVEADADKGYIPWRWRDGWIFGLSQPGPPGPRGHGPGASSVLGCDLFHGRVEAVRRVQDEPEHRRRQPDGKGQRRRRVHGHREHRDHPRLHRH